MLVRGEWGAAGDLARPQQPSSRGGAVITHSLQPNHPSFIANSSLQAPMGFPPHCISLKYNSFHQNPVSHEVCNEFYIYFLNGLTFGIPLSSLLKRNMNSLCEC